MPGVIGVPLCSLSFPLLRVSALRRTWIIFISLLLLSLDVMCCHMLTIAFLFGVVLFRQFMLWEQLTVMNKRMVSKVPFIDIYVYYIERERGKQVWVHMHINWCIQQFCKREGHRFKQRVGFPFWNCLHNLQTENSMKCSQSWCKMAATYNLAPSSLNKLCWRWTLR